MGDMVIATWPMIWGRRSPWKPVSELPLDQDALVATVVVVRRKKAHQVPIGGCLGLSYRVEHLAHRVRG